MQLSLKHWRILGFLFLLIFLLILLCAYLGLLPQALTQNDKPAHFILYAIATFLGHLAFNRRQIRLGHCFLPLFPIAFTLFTTIEEAVQSLSPNRTFDLGDLVASLVGICVGYWLAQRQQKSA